MTPNEAVNFLITQPAEFGKLLGFDKLTDLHNNWIKDMVLTQTDTTLQAHRESYKTTCLSVAIPILMILYPNRRIMFLRKSDDDVKEIVAQVDKILRKDETRYFVQQIYGVDFRLTESNAFSISTNLTTDTRGSSQLLGCGIGGGLTGKHYEYIFTDDIITIKDRFSRAERERTKTIYQELQNLCIRGNGGRIYNTGTPWHKNDCFEIMPKPLKFDVYTTKLFPAEMIEEKRAKMSPSLFAANYELKHTADNMQIFTDPQIGGNPRYIIGGRSHIDAAYGGEDYTAFSIANKVEGKIYVLGKCWRRHVDFCLDEIVAIRRKYNARRISCEKNGDKGYLAKVLRADPYREIVYGYHEKMNKQKKITTYLKHDWDKICFVDGTDDEYIEQVCEYTDNGAVHDDCPDSLSSLMREMFYFTGTK